VGSAANALMSSGRPLCAHALAGSSAACHALLWLAVLSACFGPAAPSSPNPSGTDSKRLSRAAAADAVLAEAFAYFGASREPPLAPLWQVAALEATLEGSGFHRRRGFEVVLQRSSACGRLSGPGLGPVLGAAAAAAEGACLPADCDSCARECVFEVAVLQVPFYPNRPCEGCVHPRFLLVLPISDFLLAVHAFPVEP